MSFNGGKMRHIFRTDKDGDADSAMVYTPDWFCPEAESAMCALGTGEAKMYRKIDGSCGALIKKDDQWTIYRRYDDKKGKYDETNLPEGLIALPPGENTKVYHYEQEMFSHHYFFQEIKRVDPNKAPILDKKGRPKPQPAEEKISLCLYEIVDRMSPTLTKDFYSIELVGPNFNRTPGVDTNSIALHEAQEIPTPQELEPLKTPEEWFAWLKAYFLVNRDEGLIISHLGRYWKIHGYKFYPGLKDYQKPVLLG